MNRSSLNRGEREVIASSQLLGAVDARCIDALAKLALRKSFETGQTIFRQGNPCPGVFIVDRGLVRIVRNGIGAQEHVLHLCGPDQSFAEVAVFGKFDLPATAIAVQATECVMIPAAPFQAELARNHALCLQLLAGMAQWTHHFVGMLDDLVLRDAVQRVARLLCDSQTDAAGNTVLTGAKKDLANHLNLSSETFSRALRQLNDRGLVKTGVNKALRVCDRDSLRRLSQAED